MGSAAVFFHGQFFKLGDGGFEFGGLFGLAAREVGGFEAARVVFALGLARLVRGLGAREFCGAEINFQLVRQAGDDFFDDGAFVHESFPFFMLLKNHGNPQTQIQTNE